jgi:large subunit ribosomal protein L25
MVELEVSCLPDDLPEFIEVDMLKVALGDILHISDIVLPPNVESVALSHGEDHDLPVVSLTAPKGSDAAETTEEEEGEDKDQDEE